MKEPKNKDYEIPKMLMIMVALLAGLSLLGDAGFGEFNLGTWKSRRVNLFSDLTKDLDKKASDEMPDDSIFYAQTQLAGNRQDTLANKRSDSSYTSNRVLSDTATQNANVIPVEDFSDDGQALKNFFSALKKVNQLNRPVRIAFLGDSFIEGDILTSDLREYLQSIYGGRGVGFVPLAPVDRYRNTIRIDHRYWKVTSMLNNKQASKFLLNGQCYQPDGGKAYFSVQSTETRQHAKSCDRASLVFLNNGDATLQYKLNRSAQETVELGAGDGLQVLDLDMTDIQSVELNIDKASQFLGYGLFLNDNKGVCVDNYSLRSSSGLPLMRVDTQLLEQLNSLMPYDLVILQYGLNVMEPDRQNYSHYVDQMVKVVNRLRNAMPRTSFLIFGVGDRNYRSEDGDMVTKTGVVNLVEAQRTIAREAKIAFWNTYLAMGGRNSMSGFVKHDPPLANKDYAHINYAGGRKIAGIFGPSLIDAKYRYE